MSAVFLPLPLGEGWGEGGLRVQEPSAKYLAQAEPALLRGFELLATAPGGAVRLRALIVSLALSGRLTSQSLRSSPVSVDAWPVVSLSDLSPTFQNGASSRGDIGGVPTTVIRLADITAGEISSADPRVLPIRAVDRAKYALRQGDILVIRVNGSADLVGRFIVCRSDMDAIHCDHFIRMRFDATVVFPEYLRLVGDSSSVRARVASLFVSTAGQKTVNQGHVGSITMVLPPLAEQHRIVARVEELMKLCDALEQSGRLADEQHARLTSTLFDALAASESDHALAENWQRIAEHFDLLLDRPETIDTLEQTILQLAVRGLLVPQDASEGNGLTLLRNYVQAAGASQKRARTELAPLAQEDAPFVIPTDWTWARFGEIADVSGGVTLGRKGALAKPVILPYLRVANVQRGKLNLSAEVKTVAIDTAELPRFQLKSGDLLITEGGDWDKVGRTCIWREEIATCLHQNHVFKARGHTSEWLPAWGELYLNSADARAYFAASAKQTTNLASINMTELRNCMFPLPPVAEQQRILARVEELRRLCAQLRERLTEAWQTQAILADVLVAQATTA